VGAFHNPPANSSEKTAENSRRKRFVLNGLMQAAIRLAKSLGLPLTHRNLYVIGKAIEAESNFRQISTGAAVEIIRDGAMAEAVRGGELNYFFFEDCRWRYPRLSATEKRQLENRLANERAKQSLSEWKAPKCFKCEDTGEVWNYGPGRRKLPCPDCRTEVCG
jgi:hypothetical protein